MRISDAVREIATKSPFLRFGFQHQLLNLSRLSRFIQPLVEARVGKSVKPSAILMGLSRLGKEVQGTLETDSSAFSLANMSVHTGLMIFTVEKSPSHRKVVNNVYRKVQSKDGYITISEGTHEITVILQDDFEPLLEEVKPKFTERRIGALRVMFSADYVGTPGFFYAILQQLALQNINLVEIASTATEFILYLREQDVQLAFDSLYQSFSSDGRQPLKALE